MLFGTGAAAPAMGVYIVPAGQVLVGTGAGTANTATDLVAVGNQAGHANTTGTQNTAVGYQALTATTTGTGNTAIGYQAMSAALTGPTQSTAVGALALQQMTSAGGSNTAVGYAAGQSVGGAAGNAFLGFEAGQNVYAGGHTTAVGAFSGPSADYFNVTAIGYGATSAANNTTVLGANARANSLGSVAIGVDSTGTSPTAAVQDQAVIGTSLTQLKVAGLSTAISTKTAAYSMVRADGTILCNGGFTVTLPQPSAAGAGALYQVINITGISSTITVAPYASEQINGASSYSLGLHQGAFFQTDGTNWTASQGAQGFQGVTGAQGTAGAQGTQGNQGAVGAQGTAGAQGAQGVQGAQGLNGIPTAGTQGQALVKNSTTNYDTIWSSQVEVFTQATNPPSPRNQFTVWIDPADNTTQAAGPQGPQGPQGAGANVNPLTGATGTTTVLSTQVSGQGYQSLQLWANGQILVGPGTASPGTAINFNVPNQETALGYGATVATGGTAIGHGAQSTGLNSTALGYNSAATTGNNAMALGALAKASAQGSLAIGSGAIASALGSMAIGQDSVGYGAQSSVQDQAVIGTNLTQTRVYGLSTAFAVKSANYAMVRSDGTIIANGAITITMPQPSAAGAGAIYRIISNNSVSNVTVHPYASETIGGSNPYTLYPNQGVELITDATNWYIISTSPAGIASGDLSGQYPSPRVALSYAQAYISSNVVVPASTNVNICATGSVAAGTWLVIARVLCAGLATGQVFTAWVGLNSASSSGEVAAGEWASTSTSTEASIFISQIWTLGSSPPAIYLNVYGGACTVWATTSNYAFTNVTGLTLVRVA
jgi:hypothetical protein